MTQSIPTSRLFFICLITFAVAILVWLMPAPLAFRLLVFLPSSGFFLVALTALFVARRIKRKKRINIEAQGEKILIVAPHQDDCVAIAGGYAIQTLKKGGDVHVLYIFKDRSEAGDQRKREALNAWSLLGVSANKIRFFDYALYSDLLTHESLKHGFEAIKAFISAGSYDRLFVPLYEAGHYHHDLINYLVALAVKELKRPPEVFESPEYNVCFSFRRTPEKVLSGLCRVLPGVSFDYAPEPPSNRPLYCLDMSEEELAMKRAMLACFTSQNPHMLIRRFGFPDRYQALNAHDYTRLPFDYQRSMARWLNWLKEWPILGRFFQRSIKWTKTIHPDPNYEMTRLPKFHI